MQYTSGTTGFPKGVMLTHYNVVNNGKAIGDCMDLSTADRMMIQVPMFHCFGMVLAMTASVTHGVTMSPITAFSPRKSLHCINQEKITCFHGVPTMFIAMLGHENFPTTDFSHMRTGIMAGSPCPIKTMEEVIEKKLMGTGRPHAMFRQMLGDYLAIATGDLSIFYTGEHKWTSNHGSLVEDEMLIPFIVF